MSPVFRNPSAVVFHGLGGVFVGSTHKKGHFLLVMAALLNKLSDVARPIWVTFVAV